MSSGYEGSGTRGPAAMNEDPTLPIGVDQAARPEAPTVSTTWGSFTLLARVGFGGFGEVYRAWDPHLQREVALKLLLPGAVGGEAEYEAMLREARALASVRHPNIVQVHGIDRQDGRVGFWTDFVRGKTLSVLVGEQGTFGAREAALIGLDVSRALSAVHRAGLLHRDIKAENVMREEGGRILLMDFGLSSLDQYQTNIAGTPNYMAPELFEGGQSSVATDLYAMGVLLYYLVAGDYPVKLGGLSATEALAMMSKRKPLMDLRPDLPESLLRTVSTAMEMDPARRFTSAGQLASALAESLGTPAPADVAAVSKERPRKKWKREWIVAAAVLTAAMVLGILETSGYLPRSGGRAKESGSTLSGAASDQFQKAQDMLRRSYKETNLAEAVKGFQAVLKSDPGNALAEARLGTAYFIQYRYSRDPKLLDMAKAATDRTISLDADLAEPYITLSRMAAVQGQTPLATQQVQKALQLDPRSAEAYGALGEVYAAEGRNKDAIEAYQKAIDLAPDDWRWPVSLGVNEFGQGNVAECISQLKRGIELAPDNAVAYYDLSIAHMQSNQMDEARKDLEESLRLDPTDRKYAALGSVLLFEGKYDDSASSEQKAIQLNPNNYEAWEGLGAAYQWSGTRHEAAIQAFHKAIELEEAEHAKRRQDPALLVTLAENDATIGNSSKSLVLVRQALALDADSPMVEYVAGETYEALGQREKAIPLIAKALANGYRAFGFERNPVLASLRGDPSFAAALRAEKAKKK
jgi:serine/threonine protein kinase/tetratricopeptide (TPR) repeat protein